MRRGLHRRFMISAAVLATLALVATACGSSSSSNGGTSKSGGTFIDYNTLASRPQHIDPALATDIGGAQVAGNLFDGLTEFDFTNPKSPILKPLVAKSFASNKTATVWTFTLKPGQEFSNGDPVLPSSFVYAWNRLVDPKMAAGYASLLSLVKGYDDVSNGKATSMTGLVADDKALTLTVTLTSAFADFASVVSQEALSPVPALVVSKLKDYTKWENGVIVGNGPFEMTGPETATDITFVRNPHWAGDIFGNKTAKLDKLIFKISKSLIPGYNALKAGDAQAAAIPDGKYAAVIRAGNNTIKDPQLSTYYFAFGMDRADTGGAKNLKLRQAISVAIDRERINQSVYDGSRLLADGYTPPGVPGYEAGLCHFCTYDATKAKKLLKEWHDAGNSQKSPILVQFNSGAGHEGLVQLIVNDLQAVGIKAQAAPLNGDTYFSATAHGACEMCRTGWAWDYPGYDDGLFSVFGSAAIAVATPADSQGNNQGRFDDKKFDDMINQARSTTDATAREKIYRSTESYLLNDVTALAPIVFYGGTIVYAKNVTGLVQDPTSLVAWERVGLS
jgi:oligopeptide transport system substrate-binding protein